ncbi:MAG: hypothetical protein EOO75_09670, partial [Myxococcales bacterium]
MSPYGLLVAGLLVTTVVRDKGVEARRLMAAVACYGTANNAAAAPAPAEIKREHSWGERRREVTVCLPASTSYYSARTQTWRESRDDRPAALASVAGHALLGLGASVSLRRRRRELVDRHGRDEHEAARDDYRTPAAVRRRLPPDEARAWRRAVRLALGTWALATALVAGLGSGRMPVPMPWAMLAWSALTLPAAVTAARGRLRSTWGLWVPLLG